VIAALVEHAGLDEPAAHGAFFLCGADVPADVEELVAAIDQQLWVERASVDNDTFALLRTGADAGDAVAVVCGAGFNCVGRAADGRTVRYPSLGWETGDWGGSETLGREVLFYAARAEDGRGEPTALLDLVREHFGAGSVAAVGEDVHYRRVPQQRLGGLAPRVVGLAGAGDAVSSALVDRLAGEVALAVQRARRDLELGEAAVDVVLGGGMLRPGTGYLHDAVVARLPANAQVLVPPEPPVLGAALAALEAAGASEDAGRRLREAFRDGLDPEDLR
jgi:N-acetylglucosamine kinase-like BadF-type ATPase